MHYFFYEKFFRMMRRVLYDTLRAYRGMRSLLRPLQGIAVRLRV